MNFENKTVLVTGSKSWARRWRLLLRRRARAWCCSGARWRRCRPRWAKRVTSGCTWRPSAGRPASGDALAAAVQRFGRIDVLCSLVSGFRMGDAVHEEAADSTWDFLMDINARTLLNMAKSVVPHLLAHGGGKIVNVGAFGAQRGAAKMGAYCAAKNNVIRLTEAMAAELREKTSTSTACCQPSSTRPKTAPPCRTPTRRAGWRFRLTANVVVFLASDAARAVHGAALPVTGLS